MERTETEQKRLLNLQKKLHKLQKRVDDIEGKYQQFSKSKI